MNTALWVFLAFAAAIIMFTAIQDEIPDELGFLKTKGSSTGASIMAGSVDVTEYKGWRISATGSTVEVVKPMATSLIVDGQPVIAEFGMLCNQGKLDLRVDAKLPVTGTTTTAVSMTPAFESYTPQWDKSAGTNIFPSNQLAALRHIQSTPEIRLGVTYEKHGLQTIVLTTDALREVISGLPDSCK